MSAKKISGLGPIDGSVNISQRQTTLELSSDKVSVRKSGIEFRSPSPFKEWSEMTISLHSPKDGGILACHGIIVACTGSKHAGYLVSVLFTSLSKQAQSQLDLLTQSRLGF
jgi:hypothetical protein